MEVQKDIIGYFWIWFCTSEILAIQQYHSFPEAMYLTCWTETASAQGSFTLGPSFPPNDSFVPLKLPEPDILEELVHIIFEFLSFFLADMLPAVRGRRKLGGGEVHAKAA